MVLSEQFFMMTVYSLSQRANISSVDSTLQRSNELRSRDLRLRHSLNLKPDIARKAEFVGVVEHDAGSVV